MSAVRLADASRCLAACPRSCRTPSHTRARTCRFFCPIRSAAEVLSQHNPSELILSFPGPGSGPDGAQHFHGLQNGLWVEDARASAAARGVDASRHGGEVCFCPLLLFSDGASVSNTGKHAHALLMAVGNVPAHRRTTAECLRVLAVLPEVEVAAEVDASWYGSRTLTLPHACRMLLRESTSATRLAGLRPDA